MQDITQLDTGDCVQIANGDWFTVIDDGFGAFIWATGYGNPLRYSVHELRALITGVRRQEQEKGVQLEAGKYYRRRDGKVIGPARYYSYRSNTDRQWRVHKWWYRDDGQIHQDGRHHPMDLMEEGDPSAAIDKESWLEKLRRLGRS